MTNIKAALELKQKENEELKEKIAKNEIYIQALRDVLRPAASNMRFRTYHKKPSTMSLARDLLVQTGKPMHVDEILLGIGKKRTQKNKGSLATSLAHYSYKANIFKRVSPNTFDLIERTTVQ